MSPAAAVPVFTEIRDRLKCPFGRNCPARSGIQLAWKRVGSFSVLGALIFQLLLFSQPALATHQEFDNAPVLSEKVPLAPSNWELSGDAEFVIHEGRPAMRMSSGRAIIRERSFATGYLEFDMLVTGERSFPGIVFRGADEANFESFYIRPHQSGNPDASQYTPVYNSSAAWQIYLGDGFSAPFSYRLDEWIRLRMDLYRDSALVSMDGIPLLHIHNLIMDKAEGYIGFGSSFAGALFSNVSLKSIPGHIDPAAITQPSPIDPGTILRWQVSPSMPEKEAISRASTSNWSGLQWTTITAEKSGVANIAKAAQRNENDSTAIARFSLQSPEAKEARMAFAFSDNVEVFLNGRSIYRGNDIYASRDYRFLGSVGFFDELVLSLKPGRNDIAFVVTERFGGWAAGARLVEENDNEAPEVFN